MDKNRLREIAFEKRKALNPEIKSESDLMIQKHAYEKIKDKTKPIIGFMKKEQIEKEEFLKIAHSFCLTNEEVEAIIKSL